jgi:hypothetical protein
MIVYFAMLTFACAFALASVFMPRRWRVVRGLLSMVGYGVMTIFIGLRDRVGADWDNYNGIFVNFAGVHSLALYVFVEPLYALCNSLAYAVGGDIHLVNLICAVVFLGSLYQFARLVDMDANLLLFIATPYLLFVVGMGYTRQSVAVGLVLAGIGYLRHQKVGRFYVCVALATLFHYSALILILLWLVNSIKRTTILIGVLIAASPLVFVLFSSARYVRLYLTQNEAIQSHGVGLRIAIIVLGLAIVFYQRFRWSQETELRKLIIRGAIVLGLMTVMSLFLSTLADRICLYLYFIYILGVGSAIRYAMRPFKYLSICFVVTLTYGLFFSWFGLSSFAAAAWLPYSIALYSKS